MESTSKSSFELLKGMNDPLKGKEGTVFDQPAPSGPPQPIVRQIPSHLAEIAKFLGSVVADEALLLDICMDRATDILIFNFKKRAAGNDLMQEISALHFVGAATPLAVELYKQSIEAVKDRKDEYLKLLTEAQEEMKRVTRPTSPILTP